jgi:hypothetical protein
MKPHLLNTLASLPATSQETQMFRPTAFSVVALATCTSAPPTVSQPDKDAMFQTGEFDVWVNAASTRGTVLVSACRSVTKAPSRYT